MTKVASDKCSLKKSINMLTPSGCLLEETPVLECLFLMSIAKLFRALILKNICKRLLPKICL